MLKSLIQRVAHTSVQPERDRWLGPRDEQPVAGAGGGIRRTGGADGQISVGAVYAIVAGLVAVSCCVTAFSAVRDVSWRLGAPHNLWEPALWNGTSGIVVVALLPLIRRGAMLVRTGTDRPVMVGAAVITLALIFSTLHIIGMGVLRELAYGVAGWKYAFPWSQEIPYELRKDLFVYLVLAVIFWFAARPTRAALTPVDDAAPKLAGGTADQPALWLRDGSTSFQIDPDQIVSVTSAGNYVEYALTGQRSHLIRTTLQAEQTRLAPFGVARVHRTRLVNLNRIVALQWRPSGDFEVRLDTGEIVFGSRRFKAAVAAIADRSKAASALPRDQMAK
jgi:hypothetical protein